MALSHITCCLISWPNIHSIALKSLESLYKQMLKTLDKKPFSFHQKIPYTGWKSLKDDVFWQNLHSSLCQISVKLPPLLPVSQISELLKTLAERKSPSFDPRNISTSLCTLKNTGTGSSKTNGTFRSRAVLPENISRLSKFRFKRRDHLRESLAASVPVPAVPSSQGEQPSLPSSDPVIPPFLVEESQTLPSDSVCCTGEWLSEREMHHHILDVEVSTKHQSCEPRRTPPQQFHQTGQ